MPDEIDSSAPSRALTQVLLGRERRLDVDEAEDPVAELLVVEDAAERRVLEMAVAVDEARHDDGAAEVDDGGLGMRGDEVLGRADGDDALAGHGERAVGEHGRGDGQDPVGAVDRECRRSWQACGPSVRARGARSPAGAKEYRGAPLGLANTPGGSFRRARARRYTRGTATRGEGVKERAPSSLSAEVVTSTVWDAIAQIPGSRRPVPQPAADARRARPPRAARAGAARRRRGRAAARDPHRRSSPAPP